MKITINRDKLIAAIKARQAELDAEKAKNDKATELERKKWVKDYLAELKGLVADVEAGRFDPQAGPKTQLKQYGYWPQKYRSPNKDYTHLIQQLEMSEDKTLQLDDKSDYFEFLRK